MSFWDETNWFAVQAKPYRETLAAASVSKLDLEVFLPRIRQEQMVGGIWRSVIKPLFPGYFFSRFCPVVSAEAIGCARGVLRVVGTREFPIPIGQEIIAEIQSRIEPDGCAAPRSRRFQPGDNVTIEHGPLEGLMGRVEQETDDGKRVAIFLEALSQARVLIEKRWLSTPEARA